MARLMTLLGAVALSLVFSQTSFANVENSNQELSSEQLSLIDHELEQMEIESPIEDFLDSDEDSQEFRPRPRKPRNPRRRPRRRPPRRDDRTGPFSQWKCYVQNQRGHYFVGKDRSRRKAMREALSRCHRRSHRCYRDGCEVVSRIPF